MISCEKWGADVDSAVKLALDEMNLTIEEVNVTVLEEPSRGFFGLGSKLALVRVEKKGSENEEKPKKKFEPKVTAKAKKAPAEKPTEQKKEAKEKPRKEVKEVIETVTRPENLVPCEDHVALKFIREMINEMGLDVTTKGSIGEDILYIDIEGKDSGTIIGKRGQTLDAVQYLTSLVANKEKEKYTRVVVDVENYRAKREKTLEALAERLADKVIKSKRSVRLEPMNPYERKVIHATLQNNPYVTTRSEGEDPYRRVVIELK